MRNREGYNDPTATKAIGNVMRNSNPKTLQDTIPLMTSDSYKDRFMAEYYQVKIRYNKLSHMIDNWDSLKFTPLCEKEIIMAQHDILHQYLIILCARAEIEDIDI